MLSIALKISHNPAIFTFLNHTQKRQQKLIENTTQKKASRKQTQKPYFSYIQMNE